MWQHMPWSCTGCARQGRQQPTTGHPHYTADHLQSGALTNGATERGPQGAHEAHKVHMRHPCKGEAWAEGRVACHGQAIFATDLRLAEATCSSHPGNTASRGTLGAAVKCVAALDIMLLLYVCMVANQDMAAVFARPTLVGHHGRAVTYTQQC